jgi:hypothetical protein
MVKCVDGDSRVERREEEKEVHKYYEEEELVNNGKGEDVKEGYDNCVMMVNRLK